MDREILKAKIKDKSVLFVDDDEIVTEIMKNILPQIFKDAYFAKNGEDGIRTFSDISTDLIITDISMPKLNGIEMMEKIKVNNSDVKCIYLSGHNEIDYIKQCQGKYNQYMTKPINSTMLYKALEKLFF